MTNLRIAVVSKCPASRKQYDWSIPLGTKNYKEFYLCNTYIDKLKVADITLDKAELDNYDLVIMVGAEASKVLAKLTGSVTEFQGSLIDGKYMPIINPGMIYFKPALQTGFDSAILKIKSFIGGVSLKMSDDYKGIETEKEALEWLDYLEDFNNIAVDTETTCLYPRDGYVIGVSLSATLESGRYISSDIIDDIVWERMQSLFTRKQVVFHNAKFDLSMLIYHFGFNFHTDFRHPLCYHDTMLMHYALDENSGHGLKELAVKYTNMGYYERELDLFKENYCRTHKIKKADFTYDLIPFDVLASYAAKDTSCTIALFNMFLPILQSNVKIWNMYRNLLTRGTTFLMNIQETGVPFCKNQLEIAAVELQEKYNTALAEIYSYKEVHDFERDKEVKFNPNSVFHLRSLLFDYCSLPPTGKLTDTGAISTDAEVLTELAHMHPVPDAIMSAKKTSKLLSTYIYKAMIHLDRDSRLRTNFNIHVTTSGRLSSSGKLNLQQLPRDDKTVKKCIKARKGYKIVGCDLSTAEMYYAAVLSGDKNLQAVFKTGGDFHTEVSISVFGLIVPDEDVLKGMVVLGELEKATRKCYVETFYPGRRQAAKSTSFGILYGAGPETVAEQAGISLTEAKEAIKDYFLKFPRLKRWLDDNSEAIKQKGFLYSFFGRKRRLLNAKSSDKALQSHDVRSGINFLVQSIASDANLTGAMEAYDELEAKKLDFHMFALVHDSIVSEVKDEDVDEYISIVKRNLQADIGISIERCPICVDFGVGESYAEA